MNDFGAIVAASFLWHLNRLWTFRWKSGEYFRLETDKIKDQLTKEWQDLIDFEGNANGFQYWLIVQELKADFKFRITLGAFMKYPKESLPKKQTKDIADKKYGFLSNWKAFQDVASDMGLIPNKSETCWFERHPLAC
jgi:dGTPase